MCSGGREGRVFAGRGRGMLEVELDVRERKGVKLSRRGWRKRIPRMARLAAFRRFHPSAPQTNASNVFKPKLPNRREAGEDIVLWRICRGGSNDRHEVADGLALLGFPRCGSQVSPVPTIKI